MNKEQEDLFLTGNQNYRNAIIKKLSKELINNIVSYKRKLGSAENYFATDDLKYWTYGKHIIDDNGTKARKKIEKAGYVNILKVGTPNQQKHVIAAFEEWAGNVKDSNILSKFQRDRKKDNSEFMLLVHASFLKNDFSTKTKKIKSEREEGIIKRLLVEIKSRSEKLVQEAKEEHGVTCCVCGFNFGKRYGILGEGFIEIHHLNPISKGKRVTSVDDLVPICSNCHRMIHKFKEPLSIEGLKKIYRKCCDNSNL